jgi:hypothetical protein
VDVGQWTVDIGRWTLDVGHWTLDIGRWTLDVGRWTLDRFLKRLMRPGSRSTRFSPGPHKLDVGRWTLDVGLFPVTLDAAGGHARLDSQGVYEYIKSCRDAIPRV